MPVFNNALAGAAGQGGDAGFKIERSLRFNDNDNAHLTRTFLSSGNRRKWTASWWMKLGDTSGNRGLFGNPGNSNSAPQFFSYINGSGQLEAYEYDLVNGSHHYHFIKRTQASFRDPNAWYHCVFQYDSTQSTAEDGFKMYVNGERITSWTTNNLSGYAQNYQSAFNSTENSGVHKIGLCDWYFDGLLADFHFVDGQALGPTDFGEVNADTGAWDPIEYTGDHGPTTVSYSDNGQTDLNDGNVYLSSQPVENIFDGDDTTYSRINRGTNSNTRATFVWQPTGGISGVTKIRIKYDYCTRYQINNGTWANVNNNGGYQEIYNGSAFTLTTLKIQRTDADASDYGIFVYAVEINDNLISNINNNGFHLDFSDNSSVAALGDDRSRPDYSKLSGALTTTTGNGSFYSGPASRAFDGSTSSDVKGGWVAAGDTSNLIWAPPTGSYSVSSSLRVYAGYYSTIYVNGVSKATGGHGNSATWITLNHTGAITEIKFENATNDNVVRISAIEIDGTILVSNAWTVNNLELGTTYTAANSITSSGTLQDPHYILNGLTDYDATMSNSGTGAWIEFNPPGGIAYNSKVEVMAANDNADNMRLQLNGGSLVNTIFSNQYVTLATGSGTINKIRLQGDTSLFRWRSIRVDGVVLKEVSTGDDSLLDSPTDYDDGTNIGGNYATWNSVHHETTAKSFTLSEGSLKAVYTQSSTYNSGHRGLAFSTIGMSSGKWYFELTGGGLWNNDHAVGVATAAADGYFDPEDNFWGYRANGYKYVPAPNSGGYGDPWGVNDVIGVAFDADAGSLTMYKNGTSQGVLASGLDTTETYFFVWGGDSGGSSGYTWTVTANFGQQPWVYPPGGTGGPPATYKALCTKNLDDPLIADPSTEFDTVLYTGDGQTTQTVALPFAPGLVWQKKRSGSSSHYWYDAIRGFSSSKALGSHTTAAEGNNSAYHSISVSGSNLTFGDVGAGNEWNVNTASHVIWNWDAGSSNTSISAGSLNSSVYDQSTTWSDLMSGHYQNAASAFDANGTTYAEANSGATITIDLSSDSITATSRLQVLNDPAFTGSTDVQYKIYTTSSSTPAFSKTIGGTQSFDEASSNWSSAAITKITVRGLNEGARISKVIYDGKTLVNDTTTPPDVPSIASTTRANQTAGFSIATYTGNGSANQTVAHNLGAAPAFVIIKDLTSAQNWAVMHTGAPVVGTLDGGTEYQMLELGSTAGSSNYSYDTIWHPTSTTVKIAEGANSAHWVNKNGDNYVMYAWTPVESYSAFGTYTGNGSTDGPFVYTGFRPAFIIGKRTDGGSDNWFMNDTSRLGYNAANLRLYPNLTNGEGASTDVNMDILSNGFKLISTNTNSNGSGATYIYAAFAEHPLKYARAR